MEVVEAKTVINPFKLTHISNIYHKEDSLSLKLQEMKIVGGLKQTASALRITYNF